MCCNSEDELIASVYGSMANLLKVPPPDFFKDRAILAAQNNNIQNLNSTILTHLPGAERTYFSADSYSIESPTPVDNYDIFVEFLHSLSASGLPIAQLCLKVGCPIILLRNIDSKQGLCNGTHAIIKHMTNCLLNIQLLTRDHAGETALIP